MAVVQIYAVLKAPRDRQWGCQGPAGYEVEHLLGQVPAGCHAVHNLVVGLKSGDGGFQQAVSESVT